MKSPITTGFGRKPGIPAAVFSVLMAIIGSVTAAESSTQVMRDVVSHDDLVERAREAKASGVKDPMEVFRKVEGPDPTKGSGPGDLIARSEIIVFGGVATLVPKRAVIHIPERFKARMGIKSGVKIVTWSQFNIANRGWIDTYAVSRRMAEGREQLPEGISERFAKSGKLVVATLLGGPVSVLPYVAPVEEESADGSTASINTDPTKP